eukprot:scaffold865_cov312-Prasinococcus_capsulatus_cf.AAC.12
MWRLPVLVFGGEQSAKDCKFCFIGADMDQGLLWYIGFSGDVSALAAKQEQPPPAPLRARTDP